jgi:iodotyrosine deiodinase
MITRSNDFYELMRKRRTIRKFSSEPVPIRVIQNILKTAGTAPSGANAQPWTYVVVSNPEIKANVRRIVELEEEINYDRRMGEIINSLELNNLTLITNRLF